MATRARKVLGTFSDWLEKNKQPESAEELEQFALRWYKYSLLSINWKEGKPAGVYVEESHFWYILADYRKQKNNNKKEEV